MATATEQRFTTVSWHEYMALQNEASLLDLAVKLWRVTTGEDLRAELLRLRAEGGEADLDRAIARRARKGGRA